MDDKKNCIPISAVCRKNGSMYLMVKVDEEYNPQAHVATFYDEDEVNDFLAYKDSIGQRYVCVVGHTVCVPKDTV